MSFAAHLERTSGRATPFLRRVPNAHHIDNANPAGFHLTEARSCSDKPSQLSCRHLVWCCHRLHGIRKLGMDCHQLPLHLNSIEKDRMKFNAVGGDALLPMNRIEEGDACDDDWNTRRLLSVEMVNRLIDSFAYFSDLFFEPASGRATGVGRLHDHREVLVVRV